jgi:hypothetical protein
MTNSVRGAKRVALQRTALLASTIGSESVRPRAVADDDADVDSSSSSSSSSSTAASSPVIVSVVKPKRLRVWAGKDDDDDVGAANNNDDKENATAVVNAMISADASVVMHVSSDLDPIRSLSTRDRLEQLAARKRQDEQRRKVSNYLTNLTEAELPSFSSSFIVDDLGTGVLADSQVEEEDEPLLPMSPDQAVAARQPSRSRRQVPLVQSCESIVPLAPTFVDVWTREQVDRWSHALRLAWRRRRDNPDAFLMRHIDLHASNDGWRPAARGAWSAEERLVLVERVHELRNKGVRFANAWGLLSKPLIGRTGAETKLQFEHLLRAGVIRHREFEIDESGAVHESIEVDDARDDRSLRDLPSENCLAGAWDTAQGAKLAESIDAWVAAVDVDDDDDDDIDNDDDAVIGTWGEADNDAIADMMTRLHGNRWRWADDVAGGATLHDVPLAHRMPTALMMDEQSPERPARGLRQRTLDVALHGPTHSSTTSTSRAIGRGVTAIPRLPARHRRLAADSESDFGAQQPAPQQHARPSAALESDASPPLLYAIRSDLSLVYLPDNARFGFGVDDERAMVAEAQLLYLNLTVTHIGMIAKTRACVSHLTNSLTRLVVDDAVARDCVVAVFVVSECVLRWPSVLDADLRLQLIDLMRELLLALPGTSAGMQIGATTSLQLSMHCLVHSAAFDWLAPLESASAGSAFSLAVYADWLVRALVECGEARPEQLALAAAPSELPPSSMPLLALWLATMRALAKPTAPVQFWPLVLGQLRELPGGRSELHVRERAWTLLFVLLSLDQFDAASASRPLVSQWSFVQDTLMARALRTSAADNGLAFFAERDGATTTTPAERSGAQEHYVDVLVHRCMQLAVLWPTQDALGGSSLLRVWAAFSQHFALAERPFVDVSEFACTDASWRVALPAFCRKPDHYVRLAPFDFRADRVALDVTRPWERVAMLWVGAVFLHCPELLFAERQRRRVIADGMGVPDDGDERWAQVRARDGPQCVKLVSRAAAEMARARLAHQHPLALGNVASIVSVLASLLPAVDWTRELLFAGRREPLAALLAFEAPLPSGVALSQWSAAKRLALHVCEVICAELQAGGSVVGMRYMARLYRRYAAHLLTELESLRRRLAALNSARAALRAELAAPPQSVPSARQSVTASNVKVIGGGDSMRASRAPDIEATQAKDAQIVAELAEVTQIEFATGELLHALALDVRACVARMRTEAPLSELAFVASNDDDDGGGGGGVAGPRLLTILVHSRTELQLAGVEVLECALDAAERLKAAAPSAVTPFVSALESGGVLESLAMLVRGIIGRLSNKPYVAADDRALVALLRRTTTLLMRMRSVACTTAAPIKSTHWFAHTNNWLPMSEATATVRQVSCSWPVRFTLIVAASELARDPALVTTHLVPLVSIWLRSVLEWQESEIFDHSSVAALATLTRAILVAVPADAIADSDNNKLCEAVDIMRGAPLVAAVLTRWVSTAELRAVTSIWFAVAATLDAVCNSQPGTRPPRAFGEHVASAAALVLRCERGAMPDDVRGAVVQFWKKMSSFAPLSLPAVLQSYACTDLAVVRAVMWERVVLACSGEPASDERRRRRLVMCDADERVLFDVARAVRLSSPPADWPAVTAAPFVSGDRQLHHRTADAVCQTVANWLACPVATAAGRNQWIGFQRVMLALARALISPIYELAQPERARWEADAFASYRLTVAVAQLSRMCSASEPATLQLSTRCLYFFGLAVHYAVDLLANSAPTDRIALLPFWRVVVRLAVATALCVLRDAVGEVARELQHVFEVDWYIERDKHSSLQLAAVAEAAISASSAIGASTAFVVNTRVAALPPIQLPHTKHWHAETPSDDMFEILPYVTGMFAEFGRLQDERVATTLSEVAVDLEQLAERATPHLASSVVMKLMSASRAAANGAAKARGFGVE